MPPCDSSKYFTCPLVHQVSILVLVDAALRHMYTNSHKITFHVSILVLVDAALRPEFMGVTQEEFRFQSLF